jgi:pimeloyl-ACP methyl ester carboxylesterase
VTALCFPKYLERLVLLAPGGFGRSIAPRLRLASVPALTSAARLAPELLWRRVLRRDFHKPERAPEWFFTDAIRYSRGAAAIELGRVMSQLVTLRGPRKELQRAWVDRAAEIPCPTLIMWGRHDRTVPMAEFSPFISLPSLQTHVVDDAGHLLMLEQPAVFEQRLLAFLKSPVQAISASPVA